MTAVGKPDKVSLRVLATREELGSQLARAGVTVDDGWCEALDGVVRVRLHPSDATVAAACESVLVRYAVDWSFDAGTPDAPDEFAVRRTT